MHDQQSTVLNKRPGSIILTWVVLLVATIISSSVPAEIYKWVDQNGKTHFTDKPPEQVSVQKLDLQINSFTNPNVSPFKFDSSLISNRKTSRDVVMYGASWCGYCKKAKKYF
ncbi:MAG: DUF4124 domain-containing protein, partial [Gammaproteobacteria bacterium]|nr:DUF4124 domain-containing protein [Gammaproteobacteria bacterium]